MTAPCPAWAAIPPGDGVRLVCADGSAAPPAPADPLQPAGTRKAANQAAQSVIARLAVHGALHATSGSLTG
jgi:hypothetical protein